MLMIRINRENTLAMSRKRNPALDGYFDRVNLLLWPRLKAGAGAQAPGAIAEAEWAEGAALSLYTLASHMRACKMFVPLAPPGFPALQTLFDLQLGSIKALHPTQASVDPHPRLHILAGKQPGPIGLPGGKGPARCSLLPCLLVASRCWQHQATGLPDPRCERAHAGSERCCCAGPRCPLPCMQSDTRTSPPRCSCCTPTSWTARWTPT